MEEKIKDVIGHISIESKDHKYKALAGINREVEEAKYQSLERAIEIIEMYFDVKDNR